MKKIIDLDSMLANASAEERFDDGNGDRIWDGAAARRKKAGRDKLRWLIPAAAAFTVLVSLCAVPQARAAMVETFRHLFGIMDYLNMDEGTRPDNTALESLALKDVPFETTIAEAQGGVNTGWISKLKVHIDEVLYDGLYIYVKYTVDGREVDGFCDYNANSFRTWREKKFILSDSNGVIACDAWDIYSQHAQPETDGVCTTTVRLSQANMRLSGDINVDLVLSFENETKRESTESVEPIGQSPAGTITLSFQFNADTGNSSTQSIAIAGKKHELHGSVIVADFASNTGGGDNTFVNIEKSLEGCSLSVASIVWSPAETNIVIQCEQSNPLSEGYIDPGSLELELLAGGKVVGRNIDGYAVSDGTAPPYVFTYVLSVPFLSDDVKRLTVRVKILRCTADGIAEYEFIPYGTFDIDLAK
jgi:hypothetical protein